MNIYSYLDYRDILRKLVKERQQSDSHFTFARLAQRTGIQKTYLSKVINGSADLNADQLYVITEVFQLGVEEIKFMELLLERARTALPSRRKRLEEEILQIQMRHIDTKKQLRAENKTVGTEDSFSAYYLDPYNLVVHTFLSVPRFQKNTEAIRASLGLSPEHFARIIKNLEGLGIIEWVKKNQNYQVTKEHLQLAKDSPLLEAHQSLMRALGFTQILKIQKNKKFSFQVTFSADDRTRVQIHEKFLEFLRAIEDSVRSAQPEEVYQISFDLFPWMII